MKRWPPQRAKQKQSTGMKKESECTSMLRRARNRIYKCYRIEKGNNTDLNVQEDKFE